MKFYTGIGSRETPADVLLAMTEIAKFLANESWTLRSGAAPGADTAFENGADLKEIWLPWKGFNSSISNYLPCELSFIMAKEVLGSRWKILARTHKLFHARNCNQVLGIDLETPSKFVIAWTRNGVARGGTATALKLADMCNIPVLNLGMFTENYVEEFQKFYANLRTHSSIG